MIPVSIHNRPRPRFPLAEILQRKGMSQYQLAKKSKLSPRYINQLYHGRKNPGWKIICAICAALQLSLGDFHPADRAG